MTEYVMIVVHVPLEHSDHVRAAMCDAGAGTVDDGCYDHVTFTSRAKCRYRTLSQAAKPDGQTAEWCEREEDRIEAICRSDRVSAVVQAICTEHPYETPAIAIYPTLTGEHRYWRQAS